MQVCAHTHTHTLTHTHTQTHTHIHIHTHTYTYIHWTVCMQGDPSDHLMPGLTVSSFVKASRSGRQTFFPLTGVALSPSLHGLAFRSGYAPFPPFTGER